MEVSRAIWAPAVAAALPVFKLASPFIPAAASAASRHSRQHPQAAAARRARSNSQVCGVFPITLGWFVFCSFFFQLIISN
jgi:hypothetical protein